MPGDDPPDYIFEVNGARWAVKVTQLHDYVDAWIPQSTLGVVKGLWTIWGEIERETATYRRAEYAIVLKGPIDPLDVPSIKRQAIDHIRENNPEPLECDENQGCKVFQEHGPEARLGLIPFVNGRAKLPGDKDFHADVQATVDHSVSRIIERKVPTLRSLAGFNRRALCILSQYSFADEANVRLALSQHEDNLQDVDTVFVFTGNTQTLVSM